jgi:hypothetical protein
MARVHNLPVTNSGQGDHRHIKSLQQGDRIATQHTISRDADGDESDQQADGEKQTFS